MLPQLLHWGSNQYIFLPQHLHTDDCISAALNVQHYLRVFYVTCMQNQYSTNCGLAMLPKLYTTLH